MSSPLSSRTTSRTSSRRSARRLLARSAVALLVPASLLAAPSAGSADDTTDAPNPDAPPSVSVHRAPGQRVRLEALPRIVQHGGQVAGADAARAAVVATIRPVRTGRTVDLQVQRGEAWETVVVGRQNRRGRAQFAWPSEEGGDPLTFRVVAHRVKAPGSPALPDLTSLPVSTARWQDPTWTDEFSGTELAPVWGHRGGAYARTSRRTCSKGDPSAVRVAGGAVRLSVMEDPAATTRCRIRGRDAIPGRWARRLHGHIGTEGAFSFRYGVAAARVKFHRRRGQHGAFWIQPVGGLSPGGSEIDVVEYFGDRHPQGGIATFVHRYLNSRNVTAGGWIDNSRSYLASRHDGWSRNYHVFSVEWTPRTMVFRIDGKETSRLVGRVSELRSFPILSLIASDYEVPKIAERHLPQHMYVDWIRVWETPH